MEQLTHMVNSQGNTSGAAARMFENIRDSAYISKCQRADDAQLEMVPASMYILTKLH